MNRDLVILSHTANLHQASPSQTTYVLIDWFALVVKLASYASQMLYRCNGTRLTRALNGTNGVALLKTLLCYFLSGQNGHKNAVTQLSEYSLGRMRLHFLCNMVGLAPISCNSVSLWVWLLTSCEF